MRTTPPVATHPGDLLILVAPLVALMVAIGAAFLPPLVDPETSALIMELSR